MVDLAPAVRDVKEEKLERALRATGFAGADPITKHLDLFSTAKEACPYLPASKCDQIVRFYFTAALAANELTPFVSDRWTKSIAVSDADDDISAGPGSGKTFVVFANSGSFYDLKPPRMPRLIGLTSAETHTVASIEQPIQNDLMDLLFDRQSHAHSSRRRTSSPVEPFTAFTELKHWLKLSSRQLASLLGIRRTTPNAWKREGRNPRPPTQLRLDRLHSYIATLARQPDGREKLARIRPALPTLMKAINAEAGLTSTTLTDAGIEIPLDWRRLNAFLASNRVAMTADEDGTPIAEAPPVEAMVIEEDEDDLDLLY